MRPDIFKKRMGRVVASLSDRRIGTFIITSDASISYLTGFSGSDSWLVLTAREVWLITDGRYVLAAEKQCRTCKIYERKNSIVQAAADLLKEIRAPRPVAVEDRIELAVFKALQKKLGRIKILSGIVESARQVKDEFEINSIKKAVAVAQRVLSKTLSALRIGISEIEVAAMLEFELKRAGALPAFETIVAFGDNSAMPHHRPGKRKLKGIDTVLIDFGAKVNGYCCDITRCFATGRVDDFYAKVYKTVFEAQSAAIAALKASVKAKDIDAIARKVITSAALPAYSHGLGHSIGLEVHELPAVSNRSKGSLAAGNVITVEPAVYLPGRFGIRIEDDVLITARGCEILTVPLKTGKVPLLKIK